MNVLSCFDGISAGRLALQRAGINVSTYYRAEIDKYANQVALHHYPNDVQLGDVTKWRDWDIDWASIDLISAGFPCQSWSVAGQQLGDRDARGMLFWTTLEIIKHVLSFNPNAKFLMENVKMKKDFEEYITYYTTQAVGYVEKTLINSALLSAQNRNRYYWTNFPVPQPDDKGIALINIIEDLPLNEFIPINAVFGDKYVQWDNSGKGHKSQDQRAFYITVKHGTLAASSAASKVKVCSMDGRYRKLTPLECERLQTFPDNWTDCVSNTQRYKALGNAWTVDVIAHILQCGFKS